MNYSFGSDYYDNTDAISDIDIDSANKEELEVGYQVIM